MSVTVTEPARTTPAAPAALEPPRLPGWLARMFPQGMRRRMVDVDGATMHVAEWGPPDGQAVLLLHGNPSWCFLYRKVVAELLASGEPLRLITPDLIGLGCSEKPRDPAAHTLVHHGRWVGNLIDRLGLRDLVWVGQDWGGPIGLAALEHRLDRVRAMVLLNTVVGPPRPGFQPTAFHRFAHLPVVSDLAFGTPLFPEAMMPFAQGRRASISGKTLLAYLWPNRRPADRTAPLALARLVPDSADDPAIPALEAAQRTVLAFGGPIAIVWGDRDPILGTVVRHLERLLPQAHVTRTPAGHFLQEEVPVEIAAAIRDVIARSRAN